FQLRAVIGETLDQAVDQVVRTGMRNRLHQRRHVDHAVTLEHAELEIIEIDELHTGSPRDLFPILTLRARSSECATGRLSRIVSPRSRLPSYASSTTAMALISMR